MGSIKDRMRDKMVDLKSRKGMGDIIFLKDGETRRVRILPVGDENDFIKEVEQYYMGPDIKGVISPSTFDNPCAIAEGYEDLKNSDEDGDKDIATTFSPRKRYLAFCIFYKDKAGKELDTDLSPRFIMLTSGMYQDIIELYLDDEDWGDMTDPKKGYDLKVSRTGKGKLDTEYSVKPCKNSKLPPEYIDEEYDLDEEVRKIIPSYEETEKYIASFLGIAAKGEEKKKDKKKKPKKKKSDV